LKALLLTKWRDTERNVPLDRGSHDRGEAMTAVGCAVTRRRFSVGASPTRRPLQPEATGAGMEETKCLKPSDSGHDIR